MLQNAKHLYFKTPKLSSFFMFIQSLLFLILNKKISTACAFNSIKMKQNISHKLKARFTALADRINIHVTYISELSSNNSTFPCIISIWDISDKLIYKSHVIFKSNSFFAVLLASNFRMGRPKVLLFLSFLVSSRTEALPGVWGNRGTRTLIS